MNDTLVNISVTQDLIRANGVTFLQFSNNMRNTFFDQLRLLWHCNGTIENRMQYDDVVISVDCPALLASGIAEKISNIVHNMADPYIYEVESHPKEHRMRMTTIETMGRRPDYGPDAVSPEFTTSREIGVPIVRPSTPAPDMQEPLAPHNSPHSNPTHLDTPERAPRRRIINIDIK